MAIIVNGIEYNVETAKLSRSYRKDYKYKAVTEDGVTHSEIRAVYVDFSLTLGNVDRTAYDRLMAALLASAGNVTVVLPKDSTDAGTYTGEFDGIADSVLLENEDGIYWDNLSLNFIGTVPAEVGG